MYDSLLTELRFRIGEQYELNEFNLKSIESTFISGIEYENYEYIKNDFKALFGVEFSSNIVLQYNADILSGIIYNLDIMDVDSFIQELNKHLSFSKKLISDKLDFSQTIDILNFKGVNITIDIDKVISLKVFKTLGQT